MAVTCSDCTAAVPGGSTTHVEVSAPHNKCAALKSVKGVHNLNRS